MKEKDILINSPFFKGGLGGIFMTNIEQRTAYFQQKFPDNRHQGKALLQQAQSVMLRMLKIVDDICQRHNISYWLEAGTLLGAIRHQGFIPWDDDLDISMLRQDYQKFIAIAPDELPADVFLQTEHTDKGYFNPGCGLKLRDTKSFLLEPHEREDKRFHQGIFLDIIPYDNVPHGFDHYHQQKKQTKKLIKTKRAKIVTYNACQSYITHIKYKLLGQFTKMSAINNQIAQIIDEANQHPDSEHIGFGYDISSPHTIFKRDCIFPLSRVQFEGGEFFAPGDVDQFLTIRFGDYMQLPPESERITRHTQTLRILI